MISDLFLINRIISDLGRNTTIDVSGGSLDAVSDIVDEIESNPDAFSDASDTK